MYTFTQFYAPTVTHSSSRKVTKNHVLRLWNITDKVERIIETRHILFKVKLQSGINFKQVDFPKNHFNLFRRSIFYENIQLFLLHDSSNALKLQIKHNFSVLFIWKTKHYFALPLNMAGIWQSKHIIDFL